MPFAFLASSRTIKSGMLAALLGTTLFVVPLHAASSPDGAHAIEQSFAKYLGTKAIDLKIVTVTPQGDGYQLALDLQKLVETLKSSDPGKAGQFDFKSSPLQFTIAEQADGNWSVKNEGFPEIAFKMPSPSGGVEETIKYINAKSDSLFSPKLMAFLTSKGGNDGMNISLNGANTGTVAIGPASFDLTGTDVGNGGVTTKMHQSMKDISVVLKISLPAKDGAPAKTNDITIKASDATGDGTRDSMKHKALLDLWAAFLADPTKQGLIKNQADIKAKINAALPLWNNLSGTAIINGASITTPQGVFSAKTFGETFAISGLNEHGAMQIAFNFSDLSLPAGLVPPANAPLVPSTMSLDLKLTMDGLDRMAKTVVDSIDFAAEKPIPESVGMELAGMALTGQPKLVVAPSHIVSPSMDVTIAGDVTLNGLEPSGKFTIDALGLDKTLAAFKEAAKNDPEAQKTLAGLSVIRGMAKPGPNGASSFVIEIQGKKVIINGMAIPMGGK